MLTLALSLRVFDLLALQKRQLPTPLPLPSPPQLLAEKLLLDIIPKVVKVSSLG